MGRDLIISLSFAPLLPSEKGLEDEVRKYGDKTLKI